MDSSVQYSAYGLFKVLSTGAEYLLECQCWANCHLCWWQISILLVSLSQSLRLLLYCLVKCPSYSACYCPSLDRNSSWSGKNTTRSPFTLVVWKRGGPYYSAWCTGSSINCQQNGWIVLDDTSLPRLFIANAINIPTKQFAQRTQIAADRENENFMPINMQFIHHSHLFRRILWFRHLSLEKMYH